MAAEKSKNCNENETSFGDNLAIFYFSLENFLRNIDNYDGDRDDNARHVFFFARLIYVPTAYRSDHYRHTGAARILLIK